jgi:hypothetical protein
MEESLYTAYDYVKNLFPIDGGEIDDLMHEFIGETEYLEFKASPALLEHEERSKDNQNKNYWLITKAVIALANTYGGVLLIGVQDKTKEAVEIELSNPITGEVYQEYDEYIREFLFPKVLLAEKLTPTWEYKEESKRFSYKMPDGWPTDIIEPRVFKYYDKYTIGLFVKPSKPLVGDFIFIEDDGKEVLYKRQLGTVGNVKDLRKPREIREFESSYSPHRGDLKLKLEQRGQKVKMADQKKEIHEICKSLSKLHESLFQKNSAKNIVFQTLSAEQIFESDDREDDKEALSNRDPSIHPSPRSSTDTRRFTYFFRQIQ